MRICSAVPGSIGQLGKSDDFATKQALVTSGWGKGPGYGPGIGAPADAMHRSARSGYEPGPQCISLCGACFLGKPTFRPFATR